MSTASTKPTAPLAILIQWLLFTAFGCWSGLMLGSWLTPRIANTLNGNEDSMFPYIVLLALGVTLGVVQSVALSRVLPAVKGWLRYTLMGFVGAMVVVAIASSLGLGSAAGLLDDALLFALLGAVIGLGQWRLLRQAFPQAWLWILATALGGLIFLQLAVTPAAETNEFVVRGTLYGLIAALPAGLALAWLSRQFGSLARK
ncbi:MAG TPA: hypothetical protein VN363_10675 [Anaerolineales bacterium]|nr:hypothetical protein [Anaerolineales bacterium]